jgi:hypothetical protein
MKEVIAQTKATNAALAEGAPAGTPDRYLLEDAVASYVQQNKDLERKKEEFKDHVSDAFPELGLLGAAVLISLGARLQVPLILK